MLYSFFCKDTVYHGKYPIFWANHIDENSDVLFKNIPIDNKTPEFSFVRSLFHKTVPQTDFRIVCVRKFVFILFAYFCIQIKF